MDFAEKMKTIVVATDWVASRRLPWGMRASWPRRMARGSCWRTGLDPLEYAAVESLPGDVLRGMPEQARAALDEMVADLMREGIHSHSELRQGAVVEMLLEVAGSTRRG